MKIPFTTSVIATCLIAASLTSPGLALSSCTESSSPTGSNQETPLPALQRWTFTGKEISYQSGIAVRRRELNGSLTSGLTVWLTDQAIDCNITSKNLPNRLGGWVGIKFPSNNLGKASVRVVVGFWNLSDINDVNGNIDAAGSATLTKADTSMDKTVSGTIQFHNDAFDTDSEFGMADIKGSFSVPYCPDI